MLPGAADEFNIWFLSIYKERRFFHKLQKMKHQKYNNQN